MTPPAFSVVTQWGGIKQCFFFSINVALANAIPYEVIRDDVFHLMEVDKVNLLNSLKFLERLTDLDHVGNYDDEICSPEVYNIRNLLDAAKAQEYIRIMRSEHSHVDQIIVEVYMCPFTQ